MIAIFAPFLAAAAAMLRRAILAAGILAIAGCSSKPEDCEVRDLLSEVTSPDSGWSASLYSNVCAAGLVTVPSDTAELRPVHGKATGYPGEGVVFGMDDFGPPSRSTLRLHWLNANTLRIVTPNDAFIGTQLSSYRGVVVTYTYEPDDPVVRQCLKDWLSATSNLNKSLTTWPDAKQRCTHGLLLSPRLQATDNDTAQAIAFLEFLKSGQDPRTARQGFDPKHGGHWPKERLLQFLDSGGVTFFDVNGDTTWHEPLPAIESELTRRSGRAFTMFVHLGHIYSQPYPQYSRLTFTRFGETLVVSVADWYRLTFASRGRTVRLTKIEYLQEEGE